MKNQAYIAQSTVERLKKQNMIEMRGKKMFINQGILFGLEIIPVADIESLLIKDDPIVANNIYVNLDDDDDRWNFGVCRGESAG